jgi:hypothetical protein
MVTKPGLIGNERKRIFGGNASESLGRSCYRGKTARIPNRRLRREVDLGNGRKLLSRSAVKIAVRSFVPKLRKSRCLAISRAERAGAGVSIMAPSLGREGNCSSEASSVRYSFTTATSSGSVTIGTSRFHCFYVVPDSRPSLRFTQSIVPIAALSLEVRICLAVHTDVAPVRKIAHKADQRRAALPHVAAYPP